MCVYSTLGDAWRQAAPIQYPQTFTTMLKTDISRVEFDALQAKNTSLAAEVAELREDFDNLVKLLQYANVLDRVNGTPDCEDAEKVALVKRFAELLGVDLDEVTA